MSEILVEVDDPVATITLNRPETLNALTFSMLAAFREAVDAAARDPRVVGIVVTGAGRGFCSGLDASVLQRTATAGSSTRPKTDDVPGMFTWLLSVPKPIISAVNGVAAGGGFVLTVMSDLRIASTDGSFTSIFSETRPRRRARHDVDRPAPDRHRRRARPVVVVTEDRRRRSAPRRTRPAGDRTRRPARRLLVGTSSTSPRTCRPPRSPTRNGSCTRATASRYPDALDTIDGVQYAALDRVDAKEGAAALDREARRRTFPD